MVVLASVSIHLEQKSIKLFEVIVIRLIKVEAPSTSNRSAGRRTRSEHRASAVA
jgi:hypothetical protein